MNRWDWVLNAFSAQMERMYLRNLKINYKIEIRKILNVPRPSLSLVSTALTLTFDRQKPIGDIKRKYSNEYKKTKQNLTNESVFRTNIS